MKKSELIAGLSSIHDDELVLFKDGEHVFSVASVEIAQEEPPIHGVIITADVSYEELQRITTERQAVRDAEAERIRLEDEEKAKQQAAFDEANRAAEKEAKDRLDAAVEAAVAKALGKGLKGA